MALDVTRLFNSFHTFGRNFAKCATVVWTITARFTHFSWDRFYASNNYGVTNRWAANADTGRGRVAIRLFEFTVIFVSTTLF